MKTYTFKAYGHPNLLATHVKTLEFTKDDELTERGDCIVGIKADFDLVKLKEFTKKAKLIITIQDPKSDEQLSSEFKFKINPNYSSENELVIRKSFFNSERTFGFNLNRGSNHLDRKIVELLQDPKNHADVTVQEGWR